MLPNQSKLDIADRSRTSLLPWRGQFSPELVEHLLETFCPTANKVVDPFCGSGTVLAESMRTGRTAVGIDINPAAYVLSSFSHLLSLSLASRAALSNDASRLLADHLAVPDEDLLPTTIAAGTIAEIVDRAGDPRLRLLLHIGALIGCGDSTDLSTWKLARGVQSALKTLSRIEHLPTSAHVILGDGRHEISSIPCDAIITSPPYINVFNYHQNYRPIMEHLGWLPLSCAVGEIGANRKYRQNRFLTVIQYCIDMALLFHSARCSLDENGTLVIVLGRESNVLKTAFYNGELIERVVAEIGIFQIISKHERVFTNRFGASIYEDILVLRPTSEVAATRDDHIATAREIGVDTLRNAVSRAPTSSIPMIESAILNGKIVHESPRPKLAKPPLWQPI